MLRFLCNIGYITLISYIIIIKKSKKKTKLIYLHKLESNVHLSLEILILLINTVTVLKSQVLIPSSGGTIVKLLKGG